VEAEGESMMNGNKSIVARLIGGLSFWKVFFVFLMIVGLYVAFVRYFQGLGAATNLSDNFPWGLWIGFDLLVGVGLAAGGFVIAATVHIFHIEKYEPIARPTILTAFLGYLMVIVALLFDLGQPWRIWHAIIMWNPHSVMFEVAWCVMLYTTVLALEFSPMLFERLGWQVPLKMVRAIYVPLVVAGVLLSTMHQSSLGTLYVIVPEKLHPLWYSQLLPVFFFTSAIAGGLAMTIFESYMSKRAFKRGLEMDLLSGLGRVSVVVLATYLALRGNDLLMRGAMGEVFRFTTESVLFWGEMGLGVVLPMILFAIPKVRNNEHGLFFTAVLALMGFVINRLNVAITGLQRSSGTNYFPSWMEVVVTLSIVAVGFLAFALAVKYLNVFPREELAVSSKDEEKSRQPVFAGRVILGLWLLLLIGAGLVAFSGGGSRPAVEPKLEATPVLVKNLKLPTDFTFPLSDNSPGEVVFSHAIHVEAQDRPDCSACHQLLFSLQERGKPVSGEVTYERVHEGDLCGRCHNGTKAPAVVNNCQSCHSLRDYTFPTSADSPGKVVFSHANHFDADLKDCSVCHTARFSMLGHGKPLNGQVTYERIHKGDLCAFCHNGEEAFSTVDEDECGNCHQ
jgi:c(7)-type cytochrome triheme protein